MAFTFKKTLENVSVSSHLTENEEISKDSRSHRSENLCLTNLVQRRCPFWSKRLKGTTSS